MEVQSIWMRNEVNVNPVWFVDNKLTVIGIAVIGHTELYLNVLECQDVCDGVRMKLYVTIVMYMGLVGCSDRTTITMDGHRLVRLPY